MITISAVRHCTTLTRMLLPKGRNEDQVSSAKNVLAFCVMLITFTNNTKEFNRIIYFIVFHLCSNFWKQLAI